MEVERIDTIKLLAIGDQLDNLTALSAVVRDAEPETLILTAANGPAGIDQAAAEDPDVILLDIATPGMDGFEVCRRLKADERLKDIPVVFVTALKTDTASRVKALEAGAEGFLAKPLEPSELTAQIRAMARVKAGNRSRRLEKEQLEALLDERTRALQQSEERFRLAVEDAPEAIFVQTQYRFAYLNPAAVRCFGAESADQILGQPVLDRFEPRFHELVRERIRRLSEEKAAVPTMEQTYLRMDGSPFHVEVNAAPIHWQGHDGSLVFFRDITERKRAEAALADEAGRRRLLMEQSRDGIVILDQDGRVYESNRKFAEMLGHPLESMRQLNVTDWEFQHPPERVKEMIRTIDDKGDHFETRHRRMDGSTYDVEISTNAAWFGGQKLIFCICRDITERKQAEERIRQSEARLRESEHHFRTLANGGTTLIWTSGADKLCDYFNEPWLRYTGRSLEQELGTGWADGVHPEDYDDCLSTYVTHFDRRESFSMEYRLRKADGEYGWILDLGNPRYDSDGNFTGYIGYCYDVTERKRLELERQRFFLLAESSSEFIGMCDLDMNPLYANPAGRRMVGLPDMAAACRIKVQDYFFPEDQGYIRDEFFPRVLRDGQGDVEIRLRHFQTGDAIWVFYYLFVVRDTGGQGIGWATVSRDITERKHAEAEKEKLQAQLAQAQKMESVGRLAGGVAHDFNNMLSVILGHVELAQERVGPDEALHTDLQEIQKAARSSADLTRQLLAFARKQTVAPTVLDLNQTVEGMLKMLRRLIGEDIELAWLPGDNIAPVFIDPSQVDQILANLCVNARDAIVGVGKITIETTGVSFDDAYCVDHAGFAPGDFVMLSVSDDGCGMDAETQSHLFEPFFTTKGTGRGTGLGLATVYGVVKQNQGLISIYSEPGQGTTFKIYLPRHAAPADLLPVREQASAPAAVGETILLAEDEPAILQLTTLMLEGLGYTVIAAGTPGEAIRLAREHTGRIDLLMTDVVMPEMNGRDLAGNLLSIYPDIRRLFMSGYTANVIAHRGVLDKGVHFLQKPFSKNDLAAKVREALSRE
jgi:two-component system, cell cycle sensor histidine kinase and response regulator CckA